MTRIKKNRKGGPLAISKDSRPPRPKAEQLGKAKGKGKKAGNKQTATNPQITTAAQKQPQDKRLGSQKPISLTSTVAQTKPKQAEFPPKGRAAQNAALKALENDRIFMSQLDILEDGGVLPAAQHAEFEKKLSQYDWLLNALGLMDSEEDEDEPNQWQKQGKSLKDEWL